MNVRQQYQEAYRQCRIKGSVAISAYQQPTHELRVAAHKAMQSFYARRFSHDRVETWQIAYGNAKQRSAIRRQNALFFAGDCKITF